MQLELPALARGQHAFLLGAQGIPRHRLVAHRAVRPADGHGLGKGCHHVGRARTAGNLHDPDTRRIHARHLQGAHLDVGDDLLVEPLDRTHRLNDAGLRGVGRLPSHGLVGDIAVRPGHSQRLGKGGRAARPYGIHHGRLGRHHRRRLHRHRGGHLLAGGLDRTAHLERAALAARHHGRLPVGEGIPRHGLVAHRTARPHDLGRLGQLHHAAARDAHIEGRALGHVLGHRHKGGLRAGEHRAIDHDLHGGLAARKSVLRLQRAVAHLAHDLAVLHHLDRGPVEDSRRVDGHAHVLAHRVARKRRGGAEAQLNRLARRACLRDVEHQVEIVAPHVHALVDGAARGELIGGVAHLLGNRVAVEADDVDLLVGEHDGGHAHRAGPVGDGGRIVAGDGGVAGPVVVRLHVPLVERALDAREARPHARAHDVGLLKEGVALAGVDAARAVEAVEHADVAAAQGDLHGNLLRRIGQRVAPSEGLARHRLALPVDDAVLGGLSAPGVELTQGDLRVDVHRRRPHPQGQALAVGVALGGHLHGRGKLLALLRAGALLGGAHAVHARARVLALGHVGRRSRGARRRRQGRHLACVHHLRAACPLGVGSLLDLLRGVPQRRRGLVGAGRRGACERPRRQHRGPRHGQPSAEPAGVPVHSTTAFLEAPRRPLVQHRERALLSGVTQTRQVYPIAAGTGRTPSYQNLPTGHKIAAGCSMQDGLWAIMAGSRLPAGN